MCEMCGLRWDGFFEEVGGVCQGKKKDRGVDVEDGRHQAQDDVHDVRIEYALDV